jgi:hypothetical protein
VENFRHLHVSGGGASGELGAGGALAGGCALAGDGAVAAGAGDVTSGEGWSTGSSDGSSWASAFPLVPSAMQSASKGRRQRGATWPLGSSATFEK